MHEIDDSFRKAKEQKERARRRRAIRRIWGASIATLLVVALAGVGTYYIRLQSVAVPAVVAQGDDAVQVAVPSIPVYIPKIIDLPGDPIQIELGENTSKLRTLPVPEGLTADGVAPPLHLLSVPLIDRSQNIVQAIPSSQQDFAFFQAQRTGGQPRGAGEGVRQQPPEPAAGDSATQSSAPPEKAKGGGEASPISYSGEASGDDGVADQPQGSRNSIKNNISVKALVPDLDRFRSTRDAIVRVSRDTPMLDLLQENKVDLIEAQRAQASFQAIFGIGVAQSGTVLAMRQWKSQGSDGASKLVQAAFYRSNAFVGAIALNEKGEYAEAVDPWVGKNLFNNASEAQMPIDAKFRLLDSVFSSAARNGVPASIVGEAIMYLSRKYDLNEFADPNDRLTLVYSNDGRGGDAESSGRVLYAAIDRTTKPFRCFVFRPKGSADYSCYDESDGSSASTALPAGMVVPVPGGIIRARFGPGEDPILKKTVVYKGVDWAAPLGTPVKAAYGGTVKFAGDGDDYGNLIVITLADGRETRYAHLNAFADKLKPGIKVEAGEVIGTVGSTGRSTGPHLHFEVYVHGTPVDPLQQTASSGGDDVVVLVNRIVHVESRGDPKAKNPLSSATGLGQFIESTWIRMMKTYRSDLAGSMQRDKLLELRSDPTLSREMVANLARENKAYLESAGIVTDAGRLYLAHFLGPEGARLILSSRDDGNLESILGSGVINANPFLRGKDVAYVKQWAASKMTRGGVAEAKTQVQEAASPVYLAFRQTLISLLN